MTKLITNHYLITINNWISSFREMFSITKHISMKNMGGWMLEYWKIVESIWQIYVSCMKMEVLENRQYLRFLISSVVYIYKLLKLDFLRRLGNNNNNNDKCWNMRGAGTTWMQLKIWDIINYVCIISSKCIQNI